MNMNAVRRKYRCSNKRLVHSCACEYQVKNVQVILQYKALHSPLEICKYPQSLGWRERGGQGGRTQVGRAVSLLWICGDHRRHACSDLGDSHTRMDLFQNTHFHMLHRKISSPDTAKKIQIS